MKERKFKLSVNKDLMKMKIREVHNDISGGVESNYGSLDFCFYYDDDRLLALYKEIATEDEYEKLKQTIALEDLANASEYEDKRILKIIAEHPEVVDSVQIFMTLSVPILAWTFPSRGRGVEESKRVELEEDLKSLTMLHEQLKILQDAKTSWFSKPRPSGFDDFGGWYSEMVKDEEGDIVRGYEGTLVLYFDADETLEEVGEKIDSIINPIKKVYAWYYEYVC